MLYAHINRQNISNSAKMPSKGTWNCLKETLSSKEQTSLDLNTRILSLRVCYTKGIECIHVQQFHGE